MQFLCLHCFDLTNKECNLNGEDHDDGGEVQVGQGDGWETGQQLSLLLHDVCHVCELLPHDVRDVRSG